MLKNKRILIVDDDTINITLMSDFLEEEGCIPLTASNGEIGLDILEKNNDISAVILDWIMPKMNGIEMLKKIKQNNELSKIPIIMQTSKKDKESIIHGINAGAYYYLTKPYDLNVLATILKKSIREHENQKNILKKIKEKHIDIIRNLSYGEIHYKTPEEALNIASWFSEFTHNEQTSIGLSELLINAVEHGNLGIGYDKKKEYLINNTLDLEINKRLDDLQNQNKFVTLVFENSESILKITIEDMGNGFDYGKFLTINPERVFELHGRGVAMANMIFESTISFKGKGNKVEISIPLKGSE